MIKPTIGRVVWYYPTSAEVINLALGRLDHSKPMAATIAFVWNDRLVNLSVVDHNGVQFNRTSVTLLQDDDLPRLKMEFCEWMPYQLAQAETKG